MRGIPRAGISVATQNSRSRCDLDLQLVCSLISVSKASCRNAPRIRTKMSLAAQTAWLFLLAVPVACVSWTITHEEVFREPREFCRRESEQAHNFLRRKCFYAFTCEYCLSHYVAIFSL